MKTKCQNNNVKSLTRFGITGITLCAACCALLVIGSLIGLTSIALIGYYLEKAGITVLVIGIALFVYRAFSQKGNSCDINCSCKSPKTV